VTIVCPVFNEEKSVELFYARLVDAMKVAEDRVRYELLFVNNRSTDRTLDIIRSLSEKNARVNVLTLSRNFGYQASITAGMRHARGDCVVNIDVDCEDPPEMLPRLIDKWLGGADIAYGKDAGPARLHNKGRGSFIADTRKYDHHIGETGVRDPLLCAVEDIVSAILRKFRAC